MERLIVGEILRTAAKAWPNRVMVALDDKQLTFAEAAAEADRLAALLLERGVKRGDRVCWWSETSVEAIPLFFATAHIGATFTPMNPNYTDAEAKVTLRVADPALVLSDNGRGGHESLAQFGKRATPTNVRYPEVQESDTQVIFFTSGTTGEPKGCMLPHRVQRLRGWPGNGWSEGPSVCMFPQFHMAGWTLSLGAWSRADTVIYVTRPDATNLLEAMHRWHAHTIYCIPAVWQRILDADRSRYDLSALRRADTGTSATTQALLRGIHDAFPNTDTAIAYGSTEGGRVCTLGPADIFRKPDSVGPAAPGVYCRVDEKGELLAKSPCNFSGYFNNEAATRAALVDGWYRTGELVEQDDEGYYYIVGREKDLIRTGGETVAPVEVDLVIQKHPAILDAAVAGIPDDRWGEVICAFAVLKAGATLTVEELRAFCEGKLVSHKHPRRLVIASKLPRTGATGQIQRKQLIPLARSSP